MILGCVGLLAPGSKEIGGVGKEISLLPPISQKSPIFLAPLAPASPEWGDQGKSAFIGASFSVKSQTFFPR